MNILITLRRSLSAFLAFTLLTMAVQVPIAQAAMVTTETLLDQQQADYDRQRILDVLDQEQANATLARLGVKAEDLERRVNSMTPAELAQFNAEVDKLPAGGASVIGVIVFILLLLIVLDLLGATDVFPAIRPIRVN